MSVNPRKIFAVITLLVSSTVVYADVKYPKPGTPTQAVPTFFVDPTSGVPIPSGAYAMVGYQLVGTTKVATALRLTTDGTGTASATNCGNLTADNTKASITLILTATDVDTPANGYTYYLPIGHLARFTGAASTTVQLGTPVEFSDGITTGVATAITADITNACPNVSWTPPTGNTDTWNVVAFLTEDRVQ